MAWRHPDVCNRHQKSQAREASCVYPLLGGKTRGFFLGAYGKSLRSLLRKLECDMQRLFCFWQDESHNSDHSVEGDASPLFSSGMIIYLHKPHNSRMFKNTANSSHLSRVSLIRT
ncbi:hypothetical protein J3E68DRAFT_402854 [Trichoderma sp. SZMC 28012]